MMPRLLFSICCLAMLTETLDERHVVGQQPAHGDPACLAVDGFFAEEVWAKVGERTCLKCHNDAGDAADSEFLLQDAAGHQVQRDDALRHNHGAFLRMAAAQHQDQSRLLLKIRGDLEHGGGEVLQADSTGYRLLERFVRRSRGQDDSDAAVTRYEAPPFFEGLEMMPPRRLLRRVTLSLAGRLPSESELAAIESNPDNPQAFDVILDGLLQEDAFYDRLREVFNDILLTDGYDGVAENALSYTHFHKSRHWYQQRNPHKDSPPGTDIDYRTPEMIAYLKLINEYREAMRREPLELVAHIVRHDRPITELVTADYIMVSPYTSRGYGIYEQVADKFRDPEDAFEFVPARLAALTNADNGETVQASETGFYPHAGLLSTFQYLMRYPTTETNRNRLRVRMVFQHFLGVDVMQLAPRGNDAAAITAKFETPTMQAADCVVCHKLIDPVAGLLQDYYVVDAKGVYGPRKEGWYEDMFPPGLEGEALPADERWRSLPWLGERIARDPRFAVAMVSHVWYLLSGRQPLLPPQDIDDPDFAAKRRAYRVQRDEIERIATVLAEADFNLKVVFKEWVQSPFYRVDGLAAKIDQPRRLAELDDVGAVHMLTPEQLERKLAAVFGSQWGRLSDPESKLQILYGGIDSQEITERIGEPNGAMGAIQRLLANDVACKNVAADFALPADQRRLFPDIESDVVPGASDQAERQIRQTIVHLHDRLLGRLDTVDDPEVQRTYELFAGIVADAKSRPGIEPVESYFCQTQPEVTPRDADPQYAIRAWRGVVTYLLRQHEFLYE